MPACRGERSRLFTRTVVAPSAKQLIAPERHATAPYGVVTRGMARRSAAAPTNPVVSSPRRTRVTGRPRAMSASAIQPDARPAQIIARFGTADTKPLPWTENPCAWTKQVGSHEYTNHAVQLV